jgi:hypothetical protein
MIYRGPSGFSLSYDLAPHPPPLPFVSSTGDTDKQRRERGRSGEGVGEELNHEKAWSSINHSILWLGGGGVEFDPSDLRLRNPLLDTGSPCSLGCCIAINVLAFV